MTVTRCPGCGTLFRVTQAQLEAREGQVRCGRCGTVFDARAGAVAPLAAPASSPAASVPAEGKTPGSRTRDQLESSFVLDFESRPRRGVRILWAAASALLFVALAAQAAYRYRGELALLSPQMKSALQQLCKDLGCRLPLPRHAELMSIESSELRADGTAAGILVLSATLRNRAAFTQAAPALELTLTDNEDHTLARRVLMPQDYAPRGMHPETGLPAGGELALRVFIDAGTLKPSGYRLYLFYP